MAAHTLTAWGEWPETPPKSTTGAHLTNTKNLKPLLAPKSALFWGPCVLFGCFSPISEPRTHLSKNLKKSPILCIVFLVRSGAGPVPAHARCGLQCPKVRARLGPVFLCRWRRFSPGSMSPQCHARGIALPQTAAAWLGCARVFETRYRLCTRDPAFEHI